MATENVALEIDKVSKLPLNELCNRMVEALAVEYDENAAIAANKYIINELDKTEHLVDDLQDGSEESGLVDHIMTEAGIDEDQHVEVWSLLIAACNKKWVNKSVKTVEKIHFYPEIMNITRSKNEVKENEKEQMNEYLQETKDWLIKQWDNTFDDDAQNLDLMKLFAIGKKQDMVHLPGILHEVYSQWRINYYIDSKKIPPIMTDFVRKSVAFQRLPEKNKKLICSGVQNYGHRFSPSPLVNSGFKIKDNLYEFVLYTYIMSEVVNNLIVQNTVLLPLQIDFWIIPKDIVNVLKDDFSDDDDDSDDDEKHSDNEEDSQQHQDLSIFDVENRLKLDENIKYESFESDISTQKHQVLTRNLQNAVQKVLPTLNGKRISHNRLVCIADRRNEFYDFELLDKDKEEYHDKDNKKAPIIQRDLNALKTKDKDRIFVYQPPGIYGQYPHDYGQEHLQYLSREYMLPCVVIKEKSGMYTKVQGTYNRFDSQMFTVSFCCHSKTDIRVQWFYNAWNIRLPKLENFVKIWPEFFEKSEENKEAIERIKKEILPNWKLPIVNREYEMYENDLLRFQRKKK